jgi:hypothetical protein
MNGPSMAALKTGLKYGIQIGLIMLACSFIQRYTLVIDTKQAGETHIYFIWTDGVDL